MIEKKRKETGKKKRKSGKREKLVGVSKNIRKPFPHLHRSGKNNLGFANWQQRGAGAQSLAQSLSKVTTCLSCKFIKPTAFGV